MTLSALIRKRDTGSLATAIPAISATQPNGETGTVARIATVAVANPKGEKTAPPAKADARNTVMVPFDPLRRHCPAQLTADEERTIRAWLALIEEADPATIAEVIGQCQRDADARDYFTGRAGEVMP